MLKGSRFLHYVDKHCYNFCLFWHLSLYSVGFAAVVHSYAIRFFLVAVLPFEQSSLLVNSYSQFHWPNSAASFQTPLCFNLPDCAHFLYFIFWSSSIYLFRLLPQHLNQQQQYLLSLHLSGFKVVLSTILISSHYYHSFAYCFKSLSLPLSSFNPGFIFQTVNYLLLYGWLLNLFGFITRTNYRKCYCS